MTGSSVERITWRGAPAWRKGQERIHHVSGRYFSLVVLSIEGREHLFIDQPEVGILGFLMTVHEGQPHWLVQAKAEPGNVGLTQWAPTVQATKSNYERVHGGRETPHLEAFRHVDAGDVRGSEQGDRFLNKFNRNAVRTVPASRMQDASDTTLTWTSATDFKAALLRNYEVNTDARSVVVCADWDAHVPHGRSPFEAVPWRSSHARAFRRSWFDASQQRIDAALEVLRSNAKPSRPPRRIVPIDEWREHAWTEEGVRDATGALVAGVFDCTIPEREVERWQQPLVEQEDAQQVVLLARIDGDVAWFCITGYAEPGHEGRVEFGPTLQTGTGEGKRSRDEIGRLMLEADPLDGIEQSDEGGRFWQATARYDVAVWRGAPDALTTPTSVWLTLGDLQRLAKRSGTLTNELRTVLSLVLARA